ncbi:hypothetical protein ARMGADRAFT_1037632 [Armillaria gallica]|uniref:Uncharacterized protein n=1 Tax=Armillaria gallica TaxID=47427 RepID=A0A2H3CLA4_ARMGA|nr:hypothetical protein ARMGADRAFT_1037632 [Armillaria gallica]
MSKFLLDILYTCEIIVAKLPKNIHLKAFKCNLLNTEYFKEIQEALDKLNSCKHHANDDEPGDGKEDNEEEGELSTVWVSHPPPSETSACSSNTQTKRVALKTAHADPSEEDAQLASTAKEEKDNTSALIHKESYLTILVKQKAHTVYCSMLVLPWLRQLSSPSMAALSACPGPVFRIKTASSWVEVNVATTVRPPAKASALSIQSLLKVVCANAALQVFEACTNNAALASQQYHQTLEETYFLCLHALTNEGEDMVEGILFAEPGLIKQLYNALKTMDACSRISSAIYSPLAVFCALLASADSQPRIEGSARQDTAPMVIDDSATPPSNMVLGVIETAKSPSSNVASAVLLHSPTLPISRHEPPPLPPCNNTAETIVSLVNDALLPANALLAKVTCNKPSFDSDSDRRSIVMGTHGADPDEDLLLPSTSSQREQEEFSHLLDCLQDTDNESPQHTSKKSKKKFLHHCCSSDSVHSFKKTLSTGDII